MSRVKFITGLFSNGESLTVRDVADKVIKEEGIGRYSDKAKCLPPTINKSIKELVNKGVLCIDDNLKYGNYHVTRGSMTFKKSQL